jgi:protein SCO1/2
MLHKNIEIWEYIMSSKFPLKLFAFPVALILACCLLTTVSADDSNPPRFPNTELITQDGKTVHFYDDLVKGKIVAIDLIYTSCQYACPLETARMAQVQKKLGDRVGSDIFFYSISIDPEHDTPQVLKAYMEKFHVGPGWTFLTGNKKDIDFLSRKLGVYSNPNVNADGHLPHLLIGNDATNTWIRGNALDNPSFQARMIGEFLDNFKHTDFKAEQQKKTGDGSPIANFDRGKYIFVRDCSACHTMGQGDRIGPDLLGVTSTRDHDWLVRMIQQPEQLLKSDGVLAASLLKKYNNVRMPNLSVSNDELNLLLQYFAAATAAHEKGSANSSNAVSAKPPDPGGLAHPN